MNESRFGRVSSSHFLSRCWDNTRVRDTMQMKSQK
jgi:hypothetical protein